jgi:hypothetical protein
MFFFLDPDKFPNRAGPGLPLHLHRDPALYRRPPPPGHQHRQAGVPHRKVLVPLKGQLQEMNQVQGQTD